jgi:hypothetical protein
MSRVVWLAAAELVDFVMLLRLLLPPIPNPALGIVLLIEVAAFWAAEIMDEKNPVALWAGSPPASSVGVNGADVM